MNSSISSIHLVSEYGLLTSSIQYGVVSRSHPLTGKVWKGFLDAAGTLNGFGIGNPNADATLNVSTCSLTSKGNTAKILWGFRHGEIAVTFANRVLDNSRTGGAKLIRCSVAEEHDGAVVDAVWSSDGDVFVSAGIDGRVKLWDGKKVRCLWTSERQTDNLVINPCTKIAFDSEHGTIAVALNTGDIVIWSGLISLYADSSRAEGVPIYTLARILVPALPDFIGPSQDLATISFDHQSNYQMSLLTRRLGDRFFHRFNIDLKSPKIVDEVRFGDESNGVICSIKLCLARDTQESSFVLAGDQIGHLNVYKWDESISGGSCILPVRRLEAYDDGSSVTCIEWNPTTLITGSSAGIVRVWDSVTFENLRSFASPWSRTRGEWEGVKQMILEREMLVVAVGDKVMSWKAGPIGTSGKFVVNGSKKGKNNVLAKWRRESNVSFSLKTKGPYCCC
jgi:WD40 repeat protein